jgi:transcriptional regulator NrdR family protein
MRCLQCGGRSAVIDSRARPYGVLRRRRCVVCGLRFSTIEVARDVQRQADTRLARARALVAALVAVLEEAVIEDVA